MTVPDDSSSRSAERAIHLLREATRHTPYEGRLYLVGGLPRDRLLGLPVSNDLDLVLEGDAIALAEFLYKQGLSTHYPVTYPRFGTAMIHIGEEEGKGNGERVGDWEREKGKEAQGTVIPTPNAQRPTPMDAEGSMVELVSARAESYRPDDRKPDVERGTLKDDVFRRDFTINTLL